MAGRIGLSWIIIPFALMLSLSIAGIGSAWMGGSARIPFVAGLDSYMPSWLGKIHPRYATPYAALIVQGVRFAIFSLVVRDGDLAAAVFSAGAQEVFQKLLSLAVVLQLVPFLYMFGALIRFALKESVPQGQYSRTTMFFAGTSGLLTTALGIALVFFPGAADHFAVVLRIMDVRWNSVFRRPRGFFLLCLRPPQSAATKHRKGRDLC